ncbi:MAG: Stp1/IreP family PP2C-type Ser/Thr phosphatase [Desulfitobacteriaceae bacterium]
MKVLSYSETGLVRKNNEDACLVLDKQGLMAVADGMGGHLAGEIAARTALDELAESALDLEGIAAEGLGEWLLQAFVQANRVVYESSSLRPDMKGMGTTLTALVISPQEAVVGHVGDSRAYLWRGGQLLALTDDHSLVGELLRLGQISAEEAESHPQRHMLMRAVGAAEEVEVDLQKVKTQKDDIFFLCTDGFSNLVKEEELVREFLKQGAWEGHLEALRQLVLKRGAPDNFTVLCCILE